jgi:hypothetical protein
MKTNENILEERTKAFNSHEGARVGDYLKLPYGLYTRFTYVWDDSVQTGGGAGSYYLGSAGYCSYSGGLDSGVKKTDIIQTNETKKGYIWFFKDGISGGGRGIDFEVECRVFELKEGADISGLPQIKEHEKKLIRDRAEKITLINGNGQPYTLPLPEIHINTDNINDVALKHIYENTGLSFVRCGWSYVCQPLEHKQIVALLMTYNLSFRFYNNACHYNTLMVEFNKDKN